MILCDRDKLVETEQLSLRLMLEDDTSTLVLCDKISGMNDTSTMLDSITVTCRFFLFLGKNNLFNVFYNSLSKKKKLILFPHGASEKAIVTVRLGWMYKNALSFEPFDIIKGGK